MSTDIEIMELHRAVRALADSMEPLETIATFAESIAESLYEHIRDVDLANDARKRAFMVDYVLSAVTCNSALGCSASTRRQTWDEAEKMWNDAPAFIRGEPEPTLKIAK